MRCRGAACRSRRCTGDSCRVSIQWQEPIVSVAASPLRGLSAYGSCIFLRASADRAMPQVCHCEEAAGRRGNLAGPGWITGQLLRIRKLVREIATGAKRPRNDNSGVHIILTMACTDCKCGAGPGCPLPYNLTTKNACCSCSRRSFYLLRDFVLCSYWRQPAMRLSESDMNCFSFSSKVCGPLGALS